MICRDGIERLVAPRAMQVLVALAANRGAVLSRAEINQRCWSGLHVGNDALERVVAQLRRLGFESGGGFTVEVVPRVGYRLVETADHAFSPAVGAAATVADGRRGPPRRQLLAALALGGSAAAGGVFAIRNWSGSAPSAPPAKPGPLRIAVLPFETIGPDDSSGLLAEGLVTAIRDQLSRVAGLRVIAEGSSRVAVKQALSVIATGSRLNVAMLVRGNVRESLGRVRLATELIDARDGSILWSARFEDDAQRQFAIEDAASGAVLRELVGRVGADRIIVPPRTPNRDARAVRLVMEARRLLGTSRAKRMAGDDAAGFDAADQAWLLAKRALAIDINDVAALLVVAELVRNGWTRALAAQPLTADQRVKRSIDNYVTRALAIDPNDPGALTTLGDYYRRFLWRWTEAETLFRKAIAINPSLVEAHWSYAYLLGVTGRCLEGLEHAKILSDLDPETVYRRLALPRLLYLVGDRVAAMRHYDTEMRAAPDNDFLLGELYLILLSEGDARGLRQLGQQVGKMHKGNVVTPALRRSFERINTAASAIEGRPLALIKLIDADVLAYDAPRSVGTASRRGRANIDYLYIYALEYAWAGAYDNAFLLLERALAGRAVYWPATLPYGVAPFPRAMRSDPRWRAVWSSEPQRRELVARRRKAFELGQAAGFDRSGVFHRVPSSAIRDALEAT